MPRPFSLCFLLAILFLPSLAAAVVTVRMQTDLGAIDIELFDTVAPQTVANFMNYVNDGDYEARSSIAVFPGLLFRVADSSLIPQVGRFLWMVLL